jgi:hypothetical protein
MTNPIRATHDTEGVKELICNRTTSRATMPFPTTLMFLRQ